MKNFTIEAKRNRYNDGWTSKNENFYIIIPQLGNRFFGIGAADKGRAVYQGPVIENLVFLFAQATVIDNRGGTQKDIEQNGSIEVALGDTITFNGRTFRVEDCGDRYNANLVEV